VVGEHVVQLPRDPPTLVGDRTPGPLGLLLTQSAGEFGGVPVRVPNRTSTEQYSSACPRTTAIDGLWPTSPP
jgi:hypothetical protein